MPGIVHPLPLDPEEELWFTTDWRLSFGGNSTGLDIPSGETITSAVAIPSSEAILAGHNLASVAEPAGNPEWTTVAVNVKRTGGEYDHAYAWREVVETMDSTGHTQKRKRTVLVSTVEK
jgi:hypothetical protein